MSSPQEQGSKKEKLIWGRDGEGASEHGEWGMLSGDSDGSVQRQGRNLERSSNC